MKFTIPRGKAFYCEFTIKEPGSSTPMDLTGATGTFTLSTIGLNSCVVLEDIPLAIVDAENGIMSVSLTAEQTADLVGRRGFAEDGYPMIATYKASLYIVNGSGEEIFVEVPQVYISDSGEVCPA